MISKFLIHRLAKLKHIFVYLTYIIVNKDLYVFTDSVCNIS